ncbi:MAG: hypothetical protein J7501_04415 [Bdellovibrio sp.]|nr:hypothetical protein [Bdellovibrio sp.]
MSLLFTIVFLATSLGRAQGSDRPEYKFNALGSPDFSDEKTKTKLKVSNSKDLSKVDPVRMLKNSQPYTGYVNYPRYQIGATFAPTRSGFKQEYYDLPMNFSVTSYESLMVNARYLVNPNFYADLEYSHSSFGVLGQTAGTYQVNQSTANVETILGRFIYCSIGSHAMNKLCYGGIAGWDAYPSLEFLSSASLGISAISDMVLGVSIGYEHVVAPFTSFTSTFEYLYGLCQGQSTALGVDSDSKIRAEVGLNFQNANNLNFYSLGIGYSYREARVHGAIGGYVDNWSTHTSAFAFLMKHTWTWGK